MKTVISILVATFWIADANATNLHCMDELDEHTWIRSLVVDEEANVVTLTFKESGPQQQVGLVDTKQRQSGEPIYAFNLPPEPGAEKVTNAFKLFKVGTKWRLIDAGLLEINGVFTLKALGESTIFSCTRTK